MTARDQWDLPEPYLHSIHVRESDIDAYGHVNNAVYVTWFDRTAWQHSAALGLPMERCLAMDRGMAVLRSIVTYLKPALLEDTVRVATWILPGSTRLRVRRRFQVRRDTDGVTLTRADIDYVCLELSSGRPTRWPVIFTERYAVSNAVAAAASRLPPL